MWNQLRELSEIALDLFDLGFTFLAQAENRLPVLTINVPPSTNKVLGGNDCGCER
jgi:hypothetical protein